MRKMIRHVLGAAGLALIVTTSVPQSRAIDWAGRKCLRRPLLFLSS
jgi:hypothetical protein